MKPFSPPLQFDRSKTLKNVGDRFPCADLIKVVTENRLHCFGPSGQMRDTGLVSQRYPREENVPRQSSCLLWGFPPQLKGT